MLRVTDHTTPLHEADLHEDPVLQFSRWYEQAGEAGVREPQAMALATASADGSPSVRMVLLKGFDERGFVFFSGYGSRKGLELQANPRAALLFHWDPLGRQVRIEGAVQRTSEKETAEYVRSRPRGSQLSALASPQSQTISSRAELERTVQELERVYGDRELPLPDGWGGFRVVPESIEFWQQRRDRLHDRLRYRRAAGAWVVDRLAP